MPSCCVHLRRRAVVHCRHCHAQCMCLARWASVLWCSAWAVGLSMGGGEGAAGAPCVWRAWLPSSRCAIIAVVGSSWPVPTKPVPHSSARHWGCSWLTVVVWCVLGIPNGGCGGGGTVSWPLVGRGMRVVGDRHCTLVCNARAFGPGGRWYGGGAIGAIQSSSPQWHHVVVAENIVVPRQIFGNPRPM